MNTCCMGVDISSLNKTHNPKADSDTNLNGLTPYSDGVDCSLSLFHFLLEWKIEISIAK